MSVKELNFESDSEDAVGKEVTAETQNVNASGERGTWINQKRVPLTLPLVCLIPHKILIVIRSIEKLIINSGMGTMEVGMFLSGKMNENGKLVLSEDFYIPQQEVGGASIDFQEEPPDPKWNGVIHRHPNGCKSFSGTDGQYINSNFEFSLLYVSNEITLGIYNFDNGGFRLQIPIVPEIMYPIIELNNKDAILAKITKVEMPSSTTSVTLDNYGKFHPSHGNPIWGDRRDFRHRALLTEGNDQMDFDSFFGEENRVVGDNINNIIDDTPIDEDKEELYICKLCGEVQWIDQFPFMCESCEEFITEDQADAVQNIREYDENTRDKIMLKLQEKK